jgi:hypothetical protein
MSGFLTMLERKKTRAEARDVSSYKFAGAALSRHSKSKDLSFSLKTLPVTPSGSPVRASSIHNTSVKGANERAIAASHLRVIVRMPFKRTGHP